MFLRTEKNMLWEVARELRKMKGVKMAHAVTGRFDVVAYLEFANVDQMRDIINEAQLIKGVLRTETTIAIPERIED